MTSSVQSNPLSPVPTGVDVLMYHGKVISSHWNQWFVELREKVNVINSTLASWAGINPVSGLTPGTYGDTTHYPIVTVNEFGMITAIENQTASGSSPLTTKGDIYVYSTENTRLPVGADGEVLSANSAEPTGLKFVPAGTPTLPVTTKGDLLGYSTVPARIPIGADGTVATADSTSPTGISWKPAGGTSVPDYPSTVLADSPIAFWKLDDSSGTTAVDSSGNSRNATYVGGYNLGALPAINLPGAVLFDGSTGCAHLDYSSWMALTAVTLEAWIVAYSYSSRNGIISREYPGSGTVPYGLGTSQLGSGLDMAQYNGSAWAGPNGTSSLLASTPSWNHVVGTRDSSGTLTIYINGLLAGGPTSTSGVVSENTSSGLNLGRYLTTASPQFFSGYLSCCAIYDKVLTQAQITKHYSVGSIPRWLTY